jgi:hypothetical protein
MSNVAFPPPACDPDVLRRDAVVLFDRGNEPGHASVPELAMVDQPTMRLARSAFVATHKALWVRGS